MAIHSYQRISPQINSSVFVAPSADIIGKVTVGSNASIWYGCVARGDVNEIRIGCNSNIQDLSMLHVAAAYPLIIGENVTIGHGVNLHACKIGDGCLIGIGAVVLDGAEIGANCVVAAGSVVSPGKIFSPGSLIMGIPAKVVRPLNSAEKEKYSNHYKGYVKLASEYLSEFESTQTVEQSKN